MLGADPQRGWRSTAGFSLESLAEHYFTSRRVRVAYVTDTFWSDAVRPELVKLAKGAWRLYCDSFYAKAQAKQAAQYRHMMAPQAGELAKLAKVEQLVLIHFATRYAGKYQQLIDEARGGVPESDGGGCDSGVGRGTGSAGRSRYQPCSRAVVRLAGRAPAATHR